MIRNIFKSSSLFFYINTFIYHLLVAIESGGGIGWCEVHCLLE